MNLDSLEYDDYYEDMVATLEPDFNVEPMFWYELDLEYMFF